MSLKTYTNRNMIAYFALSIPALSLQVIFILQLLSISQISLPGIFSIVSEAIRYVPWLVLALSIFAVVRFRFSLFLPLLIVSYFISAIASGNASLSAAGYLLSPSEIAALVVAAAFCSLISFGFSRAARIETKRANVSSSGPIPHQAISVFLELLFPALVAVGLIVATIRLVAALRAETLLFPAPLSTIFSNFLLSPIITIVMAALTLTLVKDIVEPWILYYTLDRDNAIALMVKEAKEMSVVRGGLRGRITSGGAVLSVIVIVIMVAVMVVFFGTTSILTNLYSVVGMGTPAREPGFLVSIDNGFIQFENLLNEIIQLLWG